MVFKLVLALTLLLSLFGCNGQSLDKTELEVFAGSELKDMEPLLGEIEQATGVKLNLHYAGTLEIAEKLENGEAADLAWLSHGKYAGMLDTAGKRVLAQEKTMLSPVIMGVKESSARAWGWIGNPNLTWRDIAAKAASGELRYAMSDPASSNSGFTALLGVTAAFSGSGDAIRPDQVDHAALTQFFNGQQLTAGSSGWLAEAYLRAEDGLNGIINYESVLMQLNEGGQLKEKLTLIYPKEGIITADYPLMLLNEAQREPYQRLIAYLRSPEFQQQMMERTLRRPVIPQIKPSDKFPSQLLVELPFPNSREVIDQILFAYLDKYRRPSHVFFVLDVSDSMDGERLDALKAAFGNLTGLDRTLTGQFSRFRSRERITLIPFASAVLETKLFNVDDPRADSTDMQQIRDYVVSLQTHGYTAIYDGVRAAYEQASKALQNDPNRFYSVVLMTDGERTSGIDQSEFSQFFDTLPEGAKQVKTFAILFGEASSGDLDFLTELTGGRVFDGRKSLGQAFKAIRGYQ